ncbi:DUF4124 domain-containing protein [Pseudomonas sp. OHS18]|uniref:DUF4124 domain-containing protein n=1 Tax=Pseudomonas sp. OHS18 TaxID=3399679 RepID=UPI003A88B905
MRAWIGLLLLPHLAFGQMYRWVDEQGRVHYGQQPQGANAQAVEIRPQVVEQDSAAREREQRAERYFQARRDEQAQAMQARREKQAQLARSAPSCVRSWPRCPRGAVITSRAPMANATTTVMKNWTPRGLSSAASCPATVNERWSVGEVGCILGQYS